MQGHGKKKKKEQGDVLTNLVRTVGDRSIEGPSIALSRVDSGFLTCLAMRRVKSSPTYCAKEKEGGRKGLKPKLKATILPQLSFMNLLRFMSQGHRRKP